MRRHTYIAENFSNLAIAVDGETNRALQHALNRAGHKLDVEALRVQRTMRGKVYTHPQSGQIVIEQTANFRKNRNEKEYRVLFPDGHTASRITVELVSAESGGRSVPCVTKIVDYREPTTKQRLQAAAGPSKRSLAAMFKDADRQITRERAMARLLKRGRGYGLPGENTGGDKLGKIASKNGATHQALVRLDGPKQREREFAVPNIGELREILPPSKLILERRMRKEMVRYPNGSYDVSQHTGNGAYTLVNYNESGTRLSQTSYGSAGEVLKTAGRQDGTATQRRRGKLTRPSDAAMALRTKQRVMKNEDRDFRRIRLSTDVEAKGAEGAYGFQFAPAVNGHIVKLVFTSGTEEAFVRLSADQAAIERLNSLMAKAMSGFSGGYTTRRISRHTGMRIRESDSSSSRRLVVDMTNVISIDPVHVELFGKWIEDNGAGSLRFVAPASELQEALRPLTAERGLELFHTYADALAGRHGSLLSREMETNRPVLPAKGLFFMPGGAGN